MHGGIMNRSATRIVLLPVFAAGFYMCLSACSRPHPLTPPPESDTIRVTRGVFVSGIDDVGLVRAVRHSSVSSGTRGQIVRLAQEGSFVRKGDPVMWLDTKEITESIETESIKLRQHLSDYERTLEALAEEHFNLEQSLKEKQANYAFDQVNVERAERELEQLRNRFNRQLISETEVFQAETRLEQLRLTETASRLALERAELEHESRLESMELESQIARQNYEQSRYTMTQLENQREALVRYAPADGVVVIKRKWNKEPYKVGDTIWHGLQVIEIPDLSEFMVWTQIPEAHLSRIHTGQSVWIRIPALENAVLDGVVDSISWLALPRELSRGTVFSGVDSDDSRGKVFEVAVRLTAQDERLRTGMNGAVVFVEERIPDVVTVPVSAVGHDESGTHVFAHQNGRFVYRPVVLGPRNRVEAVVEKGLDPGMKVAVFSLAGNTSAKTVAAGKTR